MYKTKKEIKQKMMSLDDLLVMIRGENTKNGEIN